MDFNAYNIFDSLITEITRGAELAKHLSSHMGPEHSVEIKQMLLQQIVTSYDKALFILGCVSTSEKPHQLSHVSSHAIPSTPLSATESPKSDAKEYSKKRKAASTWTKQVKVSCGSSHEGPPADGYSWRKYGQKDILRAKHSRSYYRCKYQSVQDCWATKHVQRTDDDPTVLHVTYKGKHTCDMTRRSKSAPTSPGKQELKSEDFPIKKYQHDSDIFLTTQNGMDADVQSMDIPPSAINYTNNFYGSFSPTLVSPATSGSNYFSMSPLKMETVASVQQQPQNLEGDITELLSAAASVSNSTTNDPWSFALNFPFNNL